MVQKLSPEELNNLMRLHEKHESARRDALRQAVANSGVPLPSDLAEALICLNDKHMRDILRSHRGFALAERRDSYKTSLEIMEQCLQDILTAICVFEKDAVAEHSSLLDQNRSADLNRFERKIQKELFATATAAASLVDHARRVHKCNPFSDYDAKRQECFGTDGLHEFVIALRVILHHSHVIETGWMISANYLEGTKTATFKINKDTILRAINSSDRFHGPKHTAMRNYVSAAPDNIDLRALFYDYRARIAKFHSWLKKELASDSLVALRDYDDLIRRKVSSDQRSFWGVLLGNWLNWKTPPDPHNHLPKFLTAAQLDQVYALPRNSKEQVDLVIHLMDNNNVIDDALRKQIYELFNRSPSPDSSAEPS